MDFKKFYDEQPDYAAFRTDPDRAKEYKVIVDWKARKLASLVPERTVFNNVLEIGCAMGILLNNIAGRLSIRNRYGLDISSENIRIASELFPETEFFQGTINDEVISSKVPQSGRFDLVILSDIVEHIPDDLEFMKKVRKISSFVLINLPLEKCLRNRNRQYGEDDPSGHLRCYDRDMASRLVDLAGFEVVNCFTLNSLVDREYFELYRRKRKARIKTKPLHLRLFWSFYYNAEDQVKLISKRLYEKIYGTNYFALLKSKNV